MNTHTTQQNGPTPQDMDAYRDAPFPKGFPCVTRQAWDPDQFPNRPPSCIRVNQNEEGYIHGEVGRDSNGNMVPGAVPGWYHIVLPRRNIDGVVPSAILNVGNRKYGDIQWNLHVPAPPVNVNIAPGNSVFEKTVKTLLDVLRNNTEAWSLVPDWARNHLDSHQKIDNLVNIMVRSIQAAGNGMWDLLRDGNFDMEALLDRGVMVQQDDQRGGVYMRVYWDLEDAEDSSAMYAYIGMTLAFWTRHLRHVYRAGKPGGSSHYHCAQKASQMKVFPLCIYNGDGHQETEQRQIFEQIMVLLFQTYYPGLLASINPNSLRIPFHAADPARHAISIKAACVFTQVARGVFNQTGWSVGSENQAFGLEYGFNWNSPLHSGTPERPMIVRSVIPGFELYRFTRNATVTSRPGVRRISPITGNRVAFQFPEHRVEPGTEHEHPPVGPVEVIIEIARDANGGPRPHPIPYANLPGIGAPKSWDLAQSVGIRLEWEVDGVWREKYLSVFGTGGLNSPATNFRAHRLVVGLVRYLRRQVITNRRDDTFDVGIGNVWDFSFNNLTQTFSLTRSNVLTEVDVGVEDDLYDTEYLKAAFRREGFIHFSFYSAGDINPTGQRGRRRLACDRCYLIRQRLRSEGVTCHADQGNCDNCSSTDLPCTFTSSDIIRDGMSNAAKRMRAALLPREFEGDPRLNARDMPAVTQFQISFT